MRRKWAPSDNGQIALVHTQWMGINIFPCRIPKEPWSDKKYPVHIQPSTPISIDYLIPMTCADHPRKSHELCTQCTSQCVLLWFGSCPFYPYPSGFLHWCCGTHMIRTSASEIIMQNILKWLTWIYYEWQNQNKQKKYNYVHILCDILYKEQAWFSPSGAKTKIFKRTQLIRWLLCPGSL